LRNGTTLTAGNYVVPVPRNWYPDGLNSGGQLLIRLDTDDQATVRKLKAHASISFDPTPKVASEKDIGLRMSLDVSRLKNSGVTPILQRTFTLTGGEVISCTGGYKPGSNGVFDTDPVAWSCYSSGFQITILAVEPDMNQTWNIISGIRKR